MRERRRLRIRVKFFIDLFFVFYNFFDMTSKTGGVTVRWMLY